MSKRPSLAESMKAVSAQSVSPEPEVIFAPKAMANAPVINQAEKRPYYASTRVGMKRLTVVVEPEEHRRVKRLSVDTDRSIEDLMREALADLLRKHKA